MNVPYSDPASQLTRFTISAMYFVIGLKLAIHLTQVRSGSSLCAGIPGTSASCISMVLKRNSMFESPTGTLHGQPLAFGSCGKFDAGLKEGGRSSVDERLIFAAHDRLRAIEEKAVRSTKALRRKQQRKRGYEAIRSETPANPGAMRSGLAANDRRDS